MVFIKEIVINNKPLILTNSAELYLRNNVEASGYLLLSGAFGRNLRLAAKHLGQISTQGAIIHDLSADALDEMVAEEYKIITAGGGLVVNSDNKLLMIFRRGFWDLPKGKKDKNEKIKDCAEREIMEETGLESLTVLDEIKTTYHTYTEKGMPSVKKTVWFMMETEETGMLKPQYEEDILIAKWVDAIEANILIKQSYKIVRELVTDYFIKKYK